MKKAEMILFLSFAKGELNLPMRKPARFGEWIGACLLLICFATAAFGQASRIPVAVTLHTPAKEVEVGGKVPFKIALKNLANEDVTALYDISVTLSSDAFIRPIIVIIPKGNKSVSAEAVISKSGIVKVQATAPKLSRSSVVLFARPPLTSKHGAGLARPALGPGGAEPEQAEGLSVLESQTDSQPDEGSSGVSPAHGLMGLTGATGGPSVSEPHRKPTKLFIEIPDELFPDEDIWTTDVEVVALTNDDELATVSNDVKIWLSAKWGVLSSHQVVMKAGELSTAGQIIKLTSSRDGKDIVRARSSSLASVEKEVVYSVPIPSQLMVAANPNEVVNDGRNWVNVTVFLLDQNNRPTSYSDREIPVALESSLGEIKPRQVKVPAGAFTAEAQLTSTRYGEAVVSARAMGLPEAKTTVQFFFPLLLVSFSCFGGVLGSLIRSGKSIFSGRWFLKLLVHLLIGAILGLVFYVLVLSGAVGAIPKAEIPVEIGKLATFNELGALVLGLFGGYGGRRLLTRLTGF